MGRFFKMMVEEKLRLIREQIVLLQKHVDTHWLQNEETPTLDEMKALHKALKETADSLSDVLKELKVFNHGQH